MTAPSKEKHTMRPSQNPERNLLVIQRRASGGTLRAIAGEFSISIETVRQIIAAAERKAKALAVHDVYAHLGVRTLNCLHNMSVNPENLDDLSAQNAKDLMAFPNFGQKSLDEIRQYLASKGRRLSGEASPKARNSDEMITAPPTPQLGPEHIEALAEAIDDYGEWPHPHDEMKVARLAEIRAYLESL